MVYKNELKMLKENVVEIYEQAIQHTKEISFKGEQDIVTSTDLFIEREIIKLIKDHFPNDRIHSEEFHNQSLLADRTWIIDPIDGTSNYASNLGMYVVQIALYDKNNIVLSYIYAPLFDKTFYAMKNEGAYLNDQPYHLKDKAGPSNFLISMVGISHDAKDKTYFKRILDLTMTNKYKMRMLGSIGLELALASEGIFNMLYTNVTNLWDLCPGILLLEEAGATLLNEKGTPYKLGDDHLFVAKNKIAIEFIKKIL